MMLHVATLSQNVLDALSFVWLELVMFFAAALGYVVFAGARRAAQQPVGDAGKQLQIAHGQQDFRHVVQLWPRTKPEDVEACLPLVVDAMKQLRQGTPKILTLVEQALEGQDASALNALLQDLVRAKDLDLVDAMVGLLPKLPVAPDRRSYELLLEAHKCLKNFHEVLSLAARLAHAHVSFSPAMHRCVLQAALKTQALLEARQCLPHLAGLDATDTLHCCELFLAHKEPQLCWELDAVRKGVDCALVLRLLDTVDARQVLPLVQNCRVPTEPALVVKLLKRGGPLELLEGLGQDLTEQRALELLRHAADARRPELAQRVVAQLRQKAHPLTGAGHAVLQQAVQAYLQSGAFHLAVELYEQALKGRHVEPQLAAQIAHCAQECQRPDVADQLLAKSPSELAVTLGEIRLCAKNKDAAAAVAVFDALEQQGQASALAGNCCLDCLVQCGDAERAAQLLLRLRKRQLADVVSYNTLMKLHLRTGRLPKARQLVQEMQQHGVPPNTVTYNELLNALQAKDKRAMWSLVRDMTSRGLRPNSVSCSIVLKSLHAGSEAVDVDRALGLVDAVQEQDEVLFASVMEALVRVGRLDLLSLRLQQYAQHGGLAALTAPTYGSMIKAYGKARDVERVWSLWTEMRSRAIVPTSITLGCMVDALVRNGQVGEADALVRELQADKATSGLLNTVIYSTLLKGFCQARQPDNAQRCYAAMREHGVQGNCVTFNTLVDAMCRVGKMPEAEAVLGDMRAQGLQPDVITFSTLVKGYCLAGDVDRALAVLGRMHAQGLAADEILYNALLDGCAKEQRCDDAVQLLAQMKEHKVSPSNYTLSILVKLLGRSRRLQQAFDVVETAGPKFGLTPNVQVYTCLLGACLSNRQSCRAIELHNQMVQKGVHPDQRTYACLVRGLLQLEQRDQCCACVRTAFGLPARGWDAAKRAPGVDQRLVDEVLASLRGCPRYAGLAPALQRDLQQQR